MTVSVAHVTIDCRNAVALAGFWSSLLDQPIDPDANEFFATVGRSVGAQPVLMFLQVPESKAGKNRVHIDLHTADLDTEVVRAMSLGATKLGSFAEFGTSWSKLADPEGNEFDIGASM